MSKSFKFSVLFVICFSFIVGLVGCNPFGSDDDADVVYTPATPPIVVLTRMRALVGSETAVLAACREFVLDTQKEAGVISYDMYVGSVNASDSAAYRTYWFHEVWKDQDAVNTHFSLPHFAKLVGLAQSGSYFEGLTTVGTTTPAVFQVTQQFNAYQSTPLKTYANKISYYNSNATAQATTKSLLETLAAPTSAETGCYSFGVCQGVSGYGTPDQNFQTFGMFLNAGSYATHLGTAHKTTFDTNAASALATLTTSPVAGTVAVTDVTMATTPKFANMLILPSASKRVPADLSAYVRALNPK